MCWITEKSPVKLIAEENISCFKVVNNNLTSYYKLYPYELKKTFIEAIDLPKKSSYKSNFCRFIISRGFHSYSNECRIIKEGFNNNFYHIYSSSNNIPLDLYHIPDSIILDCVIPKGSPYYINEFGEIVSKFIKPVKIKNMYNYFKKQRV